MQKNNRLNLDLIKMLKITPENVDSLVMHDDFKPRRNIEYQARYWQVVFDFCFQNGMKIDQGLGKTPQSGIHAVIDFINNNVQRAKDKNKRPSKRKFNDNR